MSAGRFITGVVAAALSTMGFIAIASSASDSSDSEERDDTGIADRASDAQEAPRRHFRMRQVADLDPREANRIYDLISGALAKVYASSGFDGAGSYQNLKRYNSAPYQSSTHGNHYLNNYANETALKYGDFEKAGKLPTGSVIFKDSFSVSKVNQDFGNAETRQIVLGPLFVMRKMEPGFNAVTGDWQYIEIQPDGELVGMTGGENADRVEYCIACHLAREQFDHLYFVPDQYRSQH